MSTTFLLIRHGAHDLLGRVLCGRMAGVCLNDAGNLQAAQLADALCAERIDAIYTSPLDRARETAAPLAARCRLAPHVEPALQEIDFGDWTGRSFDALAAEPDWDRWNRQRQLARPPGGEYALEAQLRLVAFLRQAAIRQPDAVLAVFSHADIIKSAIAWAFGHLLDLHDRFDIEPASVSRLLVAEWGTKVISLNQLCSPPPAASGRDAEARA